MLSFPRLVVFLDLSMVCLHCFGENRVFGPAQRRTWKSNLVARSSDEYYMEVAVRPRKSGKIGEKVAFFLELPLGACDDTPGRGAVLMAIHLGEARGAWGRRLPGTPVHPGLRPLPATPSGGWGGPGRAPKGGYGHERLVGVISPVFPSISSQWPPILGLDYVHSRGLQSHLLQKEGQEIWMHEFMMTAFLPDYDCFQVFDSSPTFQLTFDRKPSGKQWEDPLGSGRIP